MRVQVAIREGIKEIENETADNSKKRFKHVSW